MAKGNHAWKQCLKETLFIPERKLREQGSLNLANVKRPTPGFKSKVSMQPIRNRKRVVQLKIWGLGHFLECVQSDCASESAERKQAGAPLSRASSHPSPVGQECLSWSAASSNQLIFSTNGNVIKCEDIGLGITNAGHAVSYCRKMTLSSPSWCLGFFPQELRMFDKVTWKL